MVFKLIYFLYILYECFLDSKKYLLYLIFFFFFFFHANLLFDFLFLVVNTIFSSDINIFFIECKIYYLIIYLSMKIFMIIDNLHNYIIYTVILKNKIIY